MVNYGDVDPCDDGTPSTQSACLDIAFTSCTFDGNSADRNGGAVYLNGNASHFSSASFYSCVVSIGGILIHDE